MIFAAVWGLFLFWLLASIVFAIAKRHVGWRVLIPPAVHLAAILVFFTVPIAEWKSKLDFESNFERRMKVVTLVEEGKLTATGEFGLIKLPDEYRRLSHRGEIMVVQQEGRTAVFFFTIRGFLDNYSGFLYQSDGGPPDENAVGADIVRAMALREGWHWVACT
jgi:hypothetical protein